MSCGCCSLLRSLVTVLTVEAYVLDLPGLFSHLQVLLVDQEGVNQTPALLGIQTLLQTGAQIPVVLLADGTQLVKLFPVLDPLKEPRKVVVHLQNIQIIIKYCFISAEQLDVGGKLHLDRRRKHELSASPGSGHQVAELPVAVVKPATLHHGADDVGDGGGGQQARVEGFSCRRHNRKHLQSTSCPGCWCGDDDTHP